MKLIIVPRQARDNHRESTQNQTRFLTGRLREEQLWWLARLENFNQKIPRREVEVIARTVEARCKVRENGIFAPFIYKNEHFAKTGSGQT
jgi:hypothetical protein